jgi:hypothetical protein
LDKIQESFLKCVWLLVLSHSFSCVWVSLSGFSGEDSTIPHLL